MVVMRRPVVRRLRERRSALQGNGQRLLRDHVCLQVVKRHCNLFRPVLGQAAHRREGHAAGQERPCPSLAAGGPGDGPPLKRGVRQYLPLRVLRVIKCQGNPCGAVVVCGLCVFRLHIFVCNLRNHDHAVLRDHIYLDLAARLPLKSDMDVLGCGAGQF